MDLCKEIGCIRHSFIHSFLNITFFRRFGIFLNLEISIEWNVDWADRTKLNFLSTQDFVKVKRIWEWHPINWSIFLNFIKDFLSLFSLCCQQPFFRWFNSTRVASHPVLSCHLFFRLSLSSAIFVAEICDIFQPNANHSICVWNIICKWHTNVLCCTFQRANLLANEIQKNIWK